MRHIGIGNSFVTDSIQWIDQSISMKMPRHYDEMMVTSSINEQYESGEALDEAYAKLFEATQILERSYKKVTPEECTREQDHITEEEHNKFKSILERYKVLFNEELDLCPNKKFHFQLKEGAVPVHKKPYPLPYTLQDIFSRELESLFKDGVLKPCGMTNWASPTFIIPKGDSTVRGVSAFHELN